MQQKFELFLTVFGVEEGLIGFTPGLLHDMVHTISKKLGICTLFFQIHAYFIFKFIVPWCYTSSKTKFA